MDLSAALGGAPWAIVSLPASFIISALLTQLYGIQPGMYGLIASLPAWCNALQIVLVPMLARHLDARDMALSIAWLNLGLWIMLAAILGYMPRDNAVDAGHIFLIFFILTSLSAALSNVGWTSWIQQWVPENARGDHFGKRNRLAGIATILFLVVCMVLLDWLGSSLVAYQILLVVAALGRFFSMMWQHSIATPQGADLKLGGSGWLHQLSDLRHHPSFLRMVAFNAWIGFWTGLTAPFVPLFAFDYLDVTPGQFAFFSILSSITAAISMPLWGRVLDKNGCVPVIITGIFFWRLVDYLWCFLTPDNTWILYGMWISGGVFSAAYLLGQFNLILRLMPSNARTAAVSLNLAVMSLAAGIAPIFGGYLLQHYGDGDMPYRIGIAAMCTASMVSIFFLRGIKEPEKQTPRGVLGAMRTARQILQLQGMSFAASANTIVRKRVLPKRKTQARPSQPTPPAPQHNAEKPSTRNNEGENDSNNPQG